MSNEQDKHPRAKFSLRFTCGSFCDIQYSGDATAETIDIAIEAMQSFKRAYCSEKGSAGIADNVSAPDQQPA